MAHRTAHRVARGPGVRPPSPLPGGGGRGTHRRRGTGVPPFLLLLLGVWLHLPTIHARSGSSGGQMDCKYTYIHNATIIYVVPQLYTLCHNYIHCATIIYIVPQLYTLCHNYIHCTTIIYVVPQLYTLYHNYIRCTTITHVVPNSSHKLLNTIYFLYRPRLCIVVLYLNR